METILRSVNFYIYINKTLFNYYVSILLFEPVLNSSKRITITRENVKCKKKKKKQGTD